MFVSTNDHRRSVLTPERSYRALTSGLFSEAIHVLNPPGTKLLSIVSQRKGLRKYFRQELVAVGLWLKSKRPIPLLLPIPHYEQQSEGIRFVLALLGVLVRPSSYGGVVTKRRKPKAS